MPRGDKNRKLSDSDIVRIVQLYNSRRPDGRWYSAVDLASMFGVTDSAIIHHLQKNGVALRSNRAAHLGWNSKPIKNLPPDDELAPLCACGCENPVAWNRRKNQYNKFVEGHYRKDAPYKNRDWLRRAYVDRLQSVAEIAKECNVSQGAIIKQMDKFGIERRSLSDSLIARGSTRGEKNPAWKGGVAKWLYAFNWKRVAGKIRKRDQYTCQKCKRVFPTTSKVLHVHHIDGDKTNNADSNLITLCAACHPLGKRAEQEFERNFRR